MAVVTDAVPRLSIEAADITAKDRRHADSRRVAFLVGTRTWTGIPASADDRQDGQTAVGVELIESALENAGGTLVELGNGALAARFDDVADALRVALHIRSELTIEALPERPSRCWAIHFADGGSFDGVNNAGAALRRAAAISSVGHPDQLLVSDAAWSAVAAVNDSGYRTVDLGVHRLGDLLRPERVWQLDDDHSQGRFPQLRSLDGFRQNLPSVLSPLIGRQREVAEIASLLGRERLVTLTGAGGVGKTRLALATAAASIPGVDRICCADLSNVVESRDIAGVVLEAAGLHQVEGRSAVELLADEFDRERVLVAIDNCEHLLDAVTHFVADLLVSVHGAVVFSTSREALGLPGEVTWRVPSLDYPPRADHRSLSAAAAAEYDAVQLFCDRATRAQPDFTLDEHNAPVVASLCHDLDGIPLAIELVAAQCRHLPLEVIADDLGQHVRLLNAGQAGTVPRHETIAASIDWSYERLDPSEQALFRTLGAFFGPIPAAAAVDLCNALVKPADDVRELVGRLIDKNLLVDASVGAVQEYRMLHVVRAFALECVRDAGEFHRLRDAHAEWWTEWVEPRASEANVPTLVAVDHHYEDLLGAMRWLIDRPLPALRLLSSLAKVSQEIGRANNVVQLAEQLLTPETAASYPDQWLAAASQTSLRYDLAGSHEQLQDFIQRVRRVAELNNDDYHLAIADFQLGNDRELCESLRQHAIDREDRWVAALASTLAGQFDAEYDPAGDLQALLGAEDLDLASAQLDALQTRIRGRVAKDLGQFDQALDHAERLANSRSELMVENAALLMSQVGLLTRDDVLIDRATSLAERSLRGPNRTSTLGVIGHMRDLLDGTTPGRVDELLDGIRPFSVGTLWLLCREAIAAGSPATALRGIDRAQSSGPFNLAVQAAIKATAGANEDRAHEALDIAATHGYPLIVIDALEQLAVAAHRSDSPVEAARLLGAAERARSEINYRWRFRSEQDAVEEVQGRISSEGAHLSEAYAAGSALSTTEATEFARRSRGERGRPRFGWEALTPTEHRVIELVAEGLTNPQIAQRLLMGRSTVKSHLEHVFVKLDVRNRAHVAAEYARRQA